MEKLFLCLEKHFILDKTKKFFKVFKTVSRSSDSFYIVSYYKKCATTSWTYSRFNFLSEPA